MSGKRKGQEAVANRVRELRQARGLSQGELAGRIGRTRQNVFAIETSRCTPSTRIALELAQVLRCRVEDLFCLEADSARTQTVHHHGRTPSSGERLSLARIRGQVVAHSLGPGHAALDAFIPADGLAHVRGGARSEARLLVQPEDLDRTIVLLGCDPSLSILAAHLSRRDPRWRLLCRPAGSLAALEAIARGTAHIAGSHLRDSSPGGFNLTHARRALGREGGLVVTFAAWEQGIILAQGNPKSIRKIEDLARPGVTIVNREPGTGSRAMLDEMLGEAGIASRRIGGYDRIADGHLAIGRQVASGAADAGIGLRAAAYAFGLHFVPLGQVRFDLVIPRDHLEHPGVATMLDVLTTLDFRADLASLPGYDLSHSGIEVARY